MQNAPPPPSLRLQDKGHLQGIPTLTWRGLYSPPGPTGCTLKPDQDLVMHKAIVPKRKCPFWLLGINMELIGQFVCGVW